MIKTFVFELKTESTKSSDKLTLILTTQINISNVRFEFLNLIVTWTRNQ